VRLGRFNFVRVVLDLNKSEQLIHLHTQSESLFSAGSNTEHHRDERNKHCDASDWSVSKFPRGKAEHSTAEVSWQSAEEGILGGSREHDCAGFAIETCGGFQKKLLVVFHGAAALYSVPGEVSTA
jgi:hypothetical protein